VTANAVCSGRSRVVHSIVKQILGGLIFLHDECAIIHTDLKPESFLIEGPTYDLTVLEIEREEIKQARAQKEVDRKQEERRAEIEKMKQSMPRASEARVRVLAVRLLSASCVDSLSCVVMRVADRVALSLDVSGCEYRVVRAHLLSIDTGTRAHRAGKTSSPHRDVINIRNVCARISEDE
jgi:serine/threonine protein kinase